MKTYYELDSYEQDFAVDKALELFIKNKVIKGFDFKFKSPYCQNIYMDSFNHFHLTDQIKALAASDEIAEELYPIAEGIAKEAFYPSSKDIVIKGII